MLSCSILIFPSYHLWTESSAFGQCSGNRTLHCILNKNLLSPCIVLRHRALMSCCSSLKHSTSLKASFGVCQFTRIHLAQFQPFFSQLKMPQRTRVSVLQCLINVLIAVCSGLHYEVCLVNIALLVTRFCIDSCRFRFALRGFCFRMCFARPCCVGPCFRIALHSVHGKHTSVE